MRAEVAIGAALVVVIMLGVTGWVLLPPLAAALGTAIVIGLAAWLALSPAPPPPPDGRYPPPLTLMNYTPDLSRGRYSISCYKGRHHECGLVGAGFTLQQDCHCRCHDSQEREHAGPNS